MRHLPLIDPRPLRPSAHGEDLRRAEASGRISHHGPDGPALDEAAA